MSEISDEYTSNTYWYTRQLSCIAETSLFLGIPQGIGATITNIIIIMLQILYAAREGC